MCSVLSIMADNVYLGCKTSGVEDIPVFPLVTQDGQSFECSVSNVMLRRSLNNNCLYIVPKKGAKYLMKFFVTLERKIFELLDTAVTIRDQNALKSMLSMACFDDNGQPMVKLHTFETTSIDNVLYSNVRLECCGVYVQKKNVFIDWVYKIDVKEDSIGCDGEEDGSDADADPDAQALQEKKMSIMNILDVEQCAMSDVYEKSSQLLDLIRQIKDMLSDTECDNDNDTLKDIQLCVDEYMSAKTQIFSQV